MLTCNIESIFSTVTKTRPGFLLRDLDTPNSLLSGHIRLNRGEQGTLPLGHLHYQLQDLHLYRLQVQTFDHK